MNKRVLVACERSGRVRESFAARGHDAWSCDIVPTDHPGQHIEGDVLNILSDDWDIMIAHPPCTFLCVASNRWRNHPMYPDRMIDEAVAAEFFMALVNAPIYQIAIENPVGVMSSLYKRPTQIIHPYYFGDEFQKTTCLWLKNLPKLRYGQEVQMMMGETVPPTSEIAGHGEMRVFPSGRKMPAWYIDIGWDIDRAKIRSETFPGIAAAMAVQWGDWSGQ